MRKPTGCCRMLLLLVPALFLLLPIGITTLVLERSTRSLVNRRTRGGGYSGSGSYSISGNIDSSPTIAITGACILVYLVCVVHVCGIFELGRTTLQGTVRYQRLWAWAMFISSLVMVGASAGVLGYASSAKSSESKPQRVEDLTESDMSYTREAWVCGLSYFYPERSWPHSACRRAKAARLLLLPMVVSAAMLLISLWILIRDRGALKWFFGGKGRYAGFPSVYELRPTSPGAQHVVPPQPQWVAYAQPWPQQPVQQWPQQAYQQWPQQQPYQSFPQQPVAPLHEVAPKTDQPVFR
jgi:hypothetical protein